MKKIYYLLLVLVFSFTSCDEFLDTEPINKVSIKQYYNDEQGLTEALAGVYDLLGSDELYGRNVFIGYNACTDEGYLSRTTQTNDLQKLNINDINSANVEVTNLWRVCYNGVNRANDLIANINLPTMDETKRNVILGEALFLRGYYNFLLVTNFGDIPLKLTPTTSANDVYTPATPAKDVYNQILKDMTAAESKVATSTSYGYSSRVSKTVVQGILARVCLHMAGFPLNETSKYQDALAWAKKVKVSGEHALNTTFNSSLNVTTGTVKFTNNAYSQIFINEAKDIYDIKETMWEIDYKGDRADGFLETGRLGISNGIAMTGANHSTTLGYCYGFIRGTARLFKAYQTGDLRRDWVLAPYTFNNTTGAKVAITTTTGYGRDSAKWRREFDPNTNKNKNFGNINFPVLRYADVLLMLAESDNQVNGGPTVAAYEAVNQVRRRGYGLPINTPSVVADLPAGLSKSDFQLAIENERMLELCFEGTRHSDLIRWGKYVTTMNSIGLEITTNGGTHAYGGLGGTNVIARNVIYPIPLLELSINHELKQNPLWMN